MSFQQLSTNECPFIIGHRGGAGPVLENSVAAFRNAAGVGEQRCDGVELDIHVSADGQLMVHHDPVTRSGRRLRELTGADIRAELLPDGSQVPTLEEVLELSGALMTFVEVKELPESADESLLGLLQPRLDRVQVHSFDHRLVARLKARCPDLVTGVLSSSYPVDPIGPVRAAGAVTLWQGWELIDQALVEACDAAGVALVAWTVNTAAQVRALRGMGVERLCGDWPALLRSG